MNCEQPVASAIKHAQIIDLRIARGKMYFYVPMQSKLKFAQPIQEALNELSSEMFGKDAKPERAKATHFLHMGNNAISIPITSKKKLFGFLWNTRQVTGRACITEHDRLVQVHLWDTRYCQIVAIAYEPKPQEIKRQLIVATKLPKEQAAVLG